MNIEQLEYIVEIAKTGSLSAAANQLHVTQSALSQSVRKLEEELGTAIFSRSHAGAAATAEGKRVLQKALEALHAIDEMKELAFYEQQNFKGELDIAAFPGLMPILVRTLASVKKDYPLLRINIEENVSTSILQDIRSNRIGLGLVAMYEEEIEQAAGLIFEPVVSGRLVVCANKRSPAAQHKTIHPRDIGKYDLILYKDKFVEDFIDDLTAAYGAQSILFTTNNTESIKSTLQENLALTIGHDFSFLGQYELLANHSTLVEIVPFPQRRMQVGWLKAEKKQMSALYQKCIQRFGHELDKVRI